jgi:hypothetical protein
LLCLEVCPGQTELSVTGGLNLSQFSQESITHMFINYLLKKCSNNQCEH